MSKKKKQPRKDKVWKYKAGDLTAYERKDRGLSIWTRVLEKDTGKYIGISPLCETIRDQHGRIDPEKENAARQAAIERWKQVSAGQDAERPGSKLTLKRAVQLVLHPKTGKYVGDSDWREDVERHLQRAITILGDVLVEDIRHAHYRQIWRHMAEAHAKDSTKYGVRAAEMACGSLRAAMSWLAQEELIDPGTALPAPRWKTQMQAEWQKITGKPIAPPKKPRYSKDESARMWKHLPEADPRIQLATEIGAELRLGQVVQRTRRSDVAAYGEHEIGMVRVHGSGKKHGAEIVLTPEQRAALVAALTTGYLADLEAAYKAGGIDDYLLIGGGYLARGRAQAKNAMKPMGKRALRTYWRKLEQLAEVEHMDGRGWYGLRRRAADDAEDVEGDARVLNKMGGWKDSKTRARYQEEGRLDIAEKAAGVRAKIRPGKAPESAQFIPPNSTIAEA